ncbi:MAG: hypothetical protein IPO17_11250 [Flavobacteriales bacterium]|nr:hypothetical protein [Flavobacteriales bacterium]
MEASLAVAAFLAHATERIISAYKTILEVKLLRAQLKEKGVSEKETKGIVEHTNSMMSEQIKGIVAEALKDHVLVKETGRRNELSNALVIALNKLANRIDRGFSVEVRVTTLPERKEGERDTKEIGHARRLIASICKSLRQGIEFIKTEGEPILELPEAATKDKLSKKQG